MNIQMQTLRRFLESCANNCVFPGKNSTQLKKKIESSDLPQIKQPTRKDINEYQKVYDKAIKAGKSENDSIKKMMEAKRKEAENILLGDILRVLDNKKKNNIEITTYFRVVNKRA